MDDRPDQDVRPKAALAGESGAHAWPRQRFEVIAGCAWLDTLADGVAHAEAPANERVDIDTPGKDVASRLCRRKRNSRALHHGLDALGGDECDVRPGDAQAGIPIPSDAASRLEHSLLDTNHRLRSIARRVDVNRLDGTLLVRGRAAGGLSHFHDRRMIRPSLALSPI